ncbi:MAG: IS256 family transposase [Candidatus Omnitrophica bacterium]|nr:IS256 family transposase [Candidatus Omnitrophota bacterium]
MSCPVNFSKDTLPKQWQYVKRNLREMGILNQPEVDDFEVKARTVVEGFFQRSINGEFREQIKAEEYERTEERADIRSGTYPRLFTTTFGRARLLIPKVRKKNREYVYNLFAKYQRRRQKFDDMVVLSLLLGFSTRKQQKFFQAFIGDSVSHQTASRLLQNLSDDLHAYRTSPIEDKYRFLIIDGLWVHIKEVDIKKRPILFALGITKDGKQEIIAFKLAKGETEEEYTSFLNDLYRRGLLGKSLELIISDGSEAIIAACNIVYPYTPRQRCYTHKLRNLLQNIRHKIKHRTRMARQASRIYKSSSRHEAIRKFRIFVNRWRRKEPKAVKCFQDEFYHTLNFYDFPKEVRSAVSTTNHLERFLEEIRRRIKIQGYFKNERSLNLWIFGLIKHINLNPINQPKSSTLKQKCEILLA